MTWTLKLLGHVELSGPGPDGYDVAFKLSDKQQEILAVVALAGVVGVERSDLLRRVWNDVEYHRSNPNLRNYITGFKRYFPNLIETVDSRLVLHQDVSTDMAEFDRLVQSAELHRRRHDLAQAAAALRQAVDLWTHELFAVIVDPDFTERADEAWYLKRSQALTALSKILSELGADGEVVALVRPLVGSGRLTTSLAIEYAAALYRLDRHDEALAVVTTAEQVALEELGKVPVGLVSLRSTIEAREPLPRFTDNPTPAVPHLLSRSASSFIGRTALLTSLGSGIARAVALVGESGIGKTAIAGCVATTATLERSARVILVRCEPSDQRPLDALVRTIGEEFLSVSSAFDWFIREMERQPVLLVVDDTHHADVNLVELLTRLSSNAIGDRLGVIMTAWPGPVMERLAASDAVETRKIVGLTESEIVEFCDQVLGLPREQIPSQVLRASRGNPMLLRRLTGEESTSQLTKYTDQQRELARFAALLGLTINPDECAAVIGITPSEAMSTLVAMESAGLVALDNDHIRFAHDLLHADVLRSFTSISETAFRSRIARCESLPSWTRAIHAAKALAVEPPDYVDALLDQALADTESCQRWSDHCDLAEVRADRVQDPTVVGRLLMTAAVASERAGRLDGHDRRLVALEHAERHGDIALATQTVLTPSANGRSIADVQRISLIERVIALFHKRMNRGGSVDAAHLNTMHRLRAERLAWLGLRGSMGDQEAEIAWADATIVSGEGVSNDGLLGEQVQTRLEVLRGWITATLGSVDAPLRAKRSFQLAELLKDHGASLESAFREDVQGDCSALLARALLEAGDLPALHSALERTASHAPSPRLVDQWARATVISAIKTMDGDLEEGLHLARTAVSIGELAGFPDSVPSWVIQSVSLDAVGAPLSSSDHQRTTDILARPVKGTGNSRALRSATASLWFRDRNRSLAEEMLDDALLYFEPGSPDVSRLAASARLIEAAHGLERHSSIPREAVALMTQLGSHHVLIGMTVAWSFGPASRLVALAAASHDRESALWDQAINDCRRQGQFFWLKQIEEHRSQIAHSIPMYLDITTEPDPQVSRRKSRSRAVHQS